MPVIDRFPANLVAAKIEFRATERREADALSAFLQGAFEVPRTAPLVDQRHLQWKYWTPRPDWAGSRSFTARLNGAIVAHAAAWPVRICVPGQIVGAVHLIDWAADAKCPGAGIWLVRQIRAKAKMMVATGGRATTQRILPVLGFRKHGEVCAFARPIRPLAQTITTRDNGWRRIPRLARNLCWCATETLSIPHGWSAVPIQPEQVPPRLWPQPSATLAVTLRDAGVYRFYVDAPSVQHTLWGLTLDGDLRGYFCLAFAPYVARIADLWLPSASADDWRAAFKTAAAVAAGNRDVCEVSAWASTTIGKQALADAGFRLRDRAALTLFGGADMLQASELHVQMLDCDASFLSAGGVSYLT